VTTDFRALPSVDRVLADARLVRAAAELGSEATTSAVREALEHQRNAIRAGAPASDFDAIVADAVERAYSSLRSSLRPVINATGVIIHTNLGRAPLSESAIAAMAAVSRGYSNLEFDLDAGERGSRHEHVEALLKQVTGAEAVIAVNNNASALLLVLSALAKDRQVVISRGQLVEIGGGFRVPDVMRQSGAELVEVGTTNRTYARDYEAAITDRTAAFLRVHASNFRISGFAASVPIADLTRLARAHSLICLDDLGSGCLLDTRAFGLAPEPTPQESLAAGADLVLFSGDKLLGGPQAGVVVGRADIVATLKRHPLARALRMDKATIAALNATLLHYAKGEALREVPVWRMISTPADAILRRARRWAARIGAGATVEPSRSMVGGGSLPEESLPTYVLSIPDRPNRRVEDVAKRLRQHDPPIVARIERDRLLLDPRTVHPSEDAVLVRALKDTLS
jgi:L-seryl-tRNA(Ser) seleniumtransferase